jgi:hypothetical protein
MALATLRHKLWSAVKYSTFPQCCGNCKHADGIDWDNKDNECGVLAGLKFPIVENGICKLHSSFNGGNIKRSL